MRARTVRPVVVAALTAALIVLPVGGTPAGAKGSARQVALEWNLNAVDAVRGATVPLPKFQAEGLIYMSYVQAAVYDATMKIAGGYEPYHRFAAPSGVDVGKASAAAAIVQAAYSTLAHYLGDQPAALLDGLKAKYDAAVAALPDEGKADGLAVGRAAARDIIDLRRGDGLADPSVAFTPGYPGPGVWQFAPEPSLQFAQTPWIRSFDPFLLRRPSQFRPGPPPDLSSQRWVKGFNQVKRLGSATSSARTKRQTAIAWFYNANVINQYNQAYRDLAVARGFSLTETVRLLAMGNMVGADSLIENLSAKYHYAFWRPITAIRNAAIDSNPRTDPDPAWTPLLVTPNHPEYPGAHGSMTGSQAAVFAAVLGTNHIDLDIPGFNPATQLMDLSRHFDTARDLRRQIIHARTWGGLHYRFSSVQGVRIGRETTAWVLDRYFRPTG